MQFQQLLGVTLTKIEVNKEKSEIHFFDTCGHEYVMRHLRECCESVTLEDINGDLNDLIGTPILRTIENVGRNYSEENRSFDDKSSTWTFYTIATIKGFVDLRWYGSSNGFYSERVEFYKIACPKNRLNFCLHNTIYCKPSFFSDN